MSCNITTGTMMTLWAALLLLSPLFIHPLIHRVTMQSDQGTEACGCEVKAGLLSAGMIQGRCCGKLQARFYIFHSSQDLSQSMCQQLSSLPVLPQYQTLGSCRAVVTFGKENADVPVVITSLKADKWHQGGTGPELMCLILKHFALGHEKQRVFYRQ